MATILDMAQVALVFFTIDSSFESLFARYMSVMLQGTKGDSHQKLDAQFLQELRTLAGAVVELTTFSSITSNISHLYFYDAFDNLAKIRTKHNRIRSTSELFYMIQSELIRLAEQKVGTTLNRLVFFIGSLTSVSAMKVILETIDPNQQAMPSTAIRVLFLLLPTIALLVGLLGWKAFKSLWRPAS